MNDFKLLSITDVCKLINKDRRTLWVWVREGKFPQPLKMNGRTIGWKTETYTQWLSELEGAE
ncbi:transcriptional regulator [Photobacterium proteolyticum]|uniref:Transcriptional regulator n=1 Tax=Photobacterium proteolyticum TaxID=1903952 RepID=A0A1Q9GSB4_9GAMM|nr:AlpA family phage regulatory protein [Photobacterium proteolyticum]OLQ77608.1 transcriptional regulator [Photobacterium proteolyticum]